MADTSGWQAPEAAPIPSNLEGLELVTLLRSIFFCNPYSRIGAVRSDGYKAGTTDGHRGYPVPTEDCVIVSDPGPGDAISRGPHRIL